MARHPYRHQVVVELETNRFVTPQQSVLYVQSLVATGDVELARAQAGLKGATKMRPVRFKDALRMLAKSLSHHERTLRQTLENPDAEDGD